MNTLLIGFDSAWTRNNSGSLVGALRSETGAFEELGEPLIANFGQAEEIIRSWQREHEPTRTIVLLDQPTIVKNSSGQRDVENIVSSPVGLRHGGVQPANTGRTDMFGEDAPVWEFLDRFGGPANPLSPTGTDLVLETYPVLTLIAFGWTLPDDTRATGKLPKYNPERKGTFLDTDWKFVCREVESRLSDSGLNELARWTNEIGLLDSPHKRDQDRLDACICLLVAIHLAEGKKCMMIGNLSSGHMVVPYQENLYAELCARCRKTGRIPDDWVKIF